MKIAVVGGGYAGLACIMELRRRLQNATIHLYDPRVRHLKITHLHETLRHPRSRFEVPFDDLASRLDFEHRPAAVDFSDGVASVAGAAFDYDYIAVTTGSQSLPLPRGAEAYTIEDFASGDGRQIVDAFVEDSTRPRVATVVGGGATGVQFAFELQARLRDAGAGTTIQMLDQGSRPVPDQPVEVSDYVRDRLEDCGIEYCPDSRYCDASGYELIVERGHETCQLQSGLTLLCAGARPAPQAFSTDSTGRVDGSDNMFAAGDCATYTTRADDFMTAQVAVRQGKLIATNIDRVSRDVEPLDYSFCELGYVVSLGALDAAGWILSRTQPLTGTPAFAVKGAVEAQYDLFVAGLDTYIV
ncbi:MAG: FAD-dependent oxidoreductase [Gammaproteobacteria bacterium]|nr:FAD-dependent oxidoreductase [Gammaproteobacteria bacterium]NND59734.1 FAD-dependent oxidoreductase [Gammaproteobacteria bacterium]